jgi:hypothetical protein
MKLNLLELSLSAAQLPTFEGPLSQQRFDLDRFQSFLVYTAPGFRAFGGLAVRARCRGPAPGKEAVVRPGTTARAGRGRGSADGGAGELAARGTDSQGRACGSSSLR